MGKPAATDRRRLKSLSHSFTLDEILGFWGKRPFLAKRFPYTQEDEVSKPPEIPAMHLLPAVSAFKEPAEAEGHPSWRMDPSLLRHNQQQHGTNGIA